MPRPEPTRVFTVDDDPDFTRLNGIFLDAEEDLTCVGAANTTHELSRAVRRSRAQVVLLDLRMPGEDAFDALRSLSKDVPGVRVLVVSALEDPDVIEAAEAAGACGFVSKAEGMPALVEAVRRVTRIDASGGSPASFSSS